LREIAIKVARLQVPEGLYHQPIGLPGRTRPARGWGQTITGDEFDKTISRLSEFKSKIQQHDDEIRAVVEKYPAYYSQDILRLVGYHNLHTLRFAAEAYILSLEQLKKANLSPEQLSIFLPRMLNPEATNFRQAAAHVQNWSALFVNSRAPEARRELEKVIQSRGR
jgi:hypothetical protein